MNEENEKPVEDPILAAVVEALNNPRLPMREGTGEPSGSHAQQKFSRRKRPGKTHGKKNAASKRRSAKKQAKGRK